MLTASSILYLKENKKKSIYNLLNDLAVHFLLIILALNYLFGEKAMKEEYMYMFEIQMVLKLEETKKDNASLWEAKEVKN